MAQLINEAKRFQKLAGLITESQLNEVELKLTDLGPEFEKVVKEIFGETVGVQDINVTYRPSTDTGSKPYLYMSCVIPQTKESTKGAMLNIGFSNAEGKGKVSYQNYSKDKEATAKEFEEKLIPAFKKAAAVALGKVVKDPNQLSQSTVGGGYKYEEKDQADLDKYITELPNLSLQESIEQAVNEGLPIGKSKPAQDAANALNSIVSKIEMPNLSQKARVAASEIISLIDQDQAGNMEESIESTVKEALAKFRKTGK